MEWNVRTIGITVVLVMLVVVAIYGLVIWIRRRRYTRERFAFAALSAIVTLTFTLLASLATNLMPWYIVAALIQLYFGQEIDVPDALWSEQALLVVGYGIAVWSITRLHAQWDGGKSVQQHKREQRSESTSLILEGSDELRRIVKREPAPEWYSEPDWRQFVSQLRPVSDSLAWQEQARELLRLSSSSYAFDSTSSWHDRQGSWVGTNVDTGDLVCLYPSQTALSDAQLNQFVRYVEQMATEQKKQEVELIIAGKDEVPTSATSWRGWPIRVETEGTLLDKLVNFWDYRNEIRKRVLVDQLPDSNLTLNDVYVHSRFYPPDLEQPSQNVEPYLLEWLDEPGQRQLALLGEYGQGKSTTALMLTHHLLAEPQSKRIPILIELRGKSPRALTPEQLLATWGVQYRIDGQALMRLLIAGRLLLIFEGFDEMALVGDAQMRLKHFKTLWEFSYPEAKILITGRANFFLDDEEMKAALGIGKRFGDDRPYCEAMRLAPFDLSQIRESLRAHKPLVRDQICELAKKHPHFQDIVSRPSLLHMVSVLWEREGLAQKVDQLNSAVVMDLFVRHSYRRQGLKQEGSLDFMALTTLEREYFMMGVACYMAAKQLPNQIAGPELNQLIEGLIERIPETVSTASPAILGESRTPLRDRLQGEGLQDRVEQVKTDVRACGLLVDDPAIRGTFRFAHQSFMEYLFAATVAEQLQEERTGKAKAIFKVTNAKVEDIFKWSIALDFLSELIRHGYKQREYDIYLDKQTRRPTDDKTIVRRLFKNIGGETMPFWFFHRFSAFNDVFLRSTKANGMIWRLIWSLICPLSLIELLGLLNLIYIWRQNEPLELSMALILSALLIPFIVLNFMLIANIYHNRDLFGSKNRLKRRLWNHLCKELAITDPILHRVVGTWLLPWAKDRPFDFFLSNNDSNGQ